MKVLCDVCDCNKAAVMCCQDDAALCVDCDARVHAANELASKHQRISLSHPQFHPTCDICQEKTGYFFCLEDRALLCRDCDLSIHSVNTLSSNHQRFLLPGIRVALEALGVAETPELPTPEGVLHFRQPLQQNPQFAQYEVPQFSAAHSKIASGNGRKMAITSPPVMDMKQSSATSTKQHPSQFSPQHYNVAIPSRIQGGQGNYNDVVVPSKNTQGGMMAQQNINYSAQPRIMASQQNNNRNNNSGQTNSGMLRRSSITEYLTEGVPGWRMDDLLSFADIADGYNTTSDLSSSKADMGNLGDFDWAADINLFDDQMHGDEVQHEVPQMPSPPTASGLSRGYKVFGAVMGNLKQESSAMLVRDFDDSFVVPDLGLQHSPPPTSPPGAKRRRKIFY